MYIYVKVHVLVHGRFSVIDCQVIGVIWLL